jgi:multiple sugar transport system substrate-binding protein
MPDSFKSQFTPATIASVTPAPNTMYALPFTGYGYVLYRNLTVLKKSGIDPTVKVTTLDQWLAQMKQIHDAGFLAVPNFTLDIRAVRIMYNSFTPDPLTQWGIDFTNNKALINPDAWTAEGDFLLKVKPYASEASFGDQSITDLFTSNKLAFQIGGPWVDPTFEAAKTASGLDYDYTVIPGVTADRVSDVNGGEYISINTKGPHADLAWQLATFMDDAAQIGPSAETTGQTNQNSAAMAKVTNPLVKVVFQGLSQGPVLFDSPPFFVEPYPDNYEQTIVNNMNGIYTGKTTSADGAAQLIPALNTLIANRNK